MRIVFMGTPDFALPSLRRMYADGHDIVSVFTQPDKPGDRGLKVRHSPVKELALERGTAVFQPPSLKAGAATELLRELEFDLIVVVAYGRILPPDLLELPPLGCINIHASLLPKYRGAAPIQWAILNGEKETGVTSMYISAELDAGDMLYSSKTRIGDNESAGELAGRLSLLGAELLSDTLVSLAEGRAVRSPQNREEATYAPPLSKSMSPIDWTDTARRIKCRINALDPWPSATFEIAGTVLKVFAADVVQGNTGNAPGTIVAAGAKGLEVACADGSVVITELQAPGSKRMHAADYIRGHEKIRELVGRRQE